MNSFYKNDDIIEYIFIFLPKMTSICYYSYTIQPDIDSICKISLVSKKFNYYCLMNDDGKKKQKKYKEFITNSYKLRKVSKKFIKEKNKKTFQLPSLYNNMIAEFTFEHIYKKYNIQKKKKTIFYNNFSKSNIYNITFTKKNQSDHIIIIYDFIELSILAIEQKHSDIIEKLKEIMRYYRILPIEVFKKYVQYIVDITTKQINIFNGYSYNTNCLLKISTWTLLFTLIHINQDYAKKSKLYEVFTLKKLEIIEELNNLSGKNKQFTKKFCKSIISHYQEF